MSDKLEQGNKLEETLKKEIQSQYKIYKEYNGYLEDFAGTINDYMLFDKVQSNPILCSPSEHFKIKPIPKTTKQSYPEITAGQYSKDDVAKLFGNISSSDTKPEKRRMVPKEILPTQLETSKKKKKTRQRKICCKKKNNTVSVYLCKHSQRIYGTECQKWFSYFTRWIMRNLGQW